MDTSKTKWKINGVQLVGGQYYMIIVGEHFFDFLTLKITQDAANQLIEKNIVPSPNPEQAPAHYTTMRSRCKERPNDWARRKQSHSACLWVAPPQHLIISPILGLTEGLGQA